MLFNSLEFIVFFLPLILVGYYWIGRRSHQGGTIWLFMASLLFYGYWDYRYVGLLVASIAFNYGASTLLLRERSVRMSRLIAGAAITVNLLGLCYFKYANFLILNINQVAGTEFPFANIVLPLGISFFTFTQIAYLVDTCQGKVRERSFLRYSLFVTYFPHLIAGPVLHHAEMMPQFSDQAATRIEERNISLGLRVFILGLAKKTLIADAMGNIANPIFNAVSSGQHTQIIESWTGALAYTLQIYFDFSAYSEMAIGISLLFNVRLPLNFNSPYQASSIIDFWKRWHMTLSRFLRDYLYIPLGGNRRGPMRRYANLIATMLLGGLWHGPSWTFALWGLLHGAYLVINHGWRELKSRAGLGDGGRIMRGVAIAITFIAVVVGWVLFRSANIASAYEMLKGMAGINGIVVPPEIYAFVGGLLPGRDILVMGDNQLPVTLQAQKMTAATLLFGLVVVWYMPNVRQLLKPDSIVVNDQDHGAEPSGDQGALIPRIVHRLATGTSRKHGILYGVGLFLLIVYIISAKRSEFLYFQF
jgi:alginate O-acetyltransferase complex protein AlgI